MGSLLDRILEWENIQRAMKRVCANKGSSGVDGMKVEELDLYMSDHWKEIEQAIRERRYKPQPVERVEIPKENGGVRKLGIPTVVKACDESHRIKDFKELLDWYFGKQLFYCGFLRSGFVAAPFSNAACFSY